MPGLCPLELLPDDGLGLLPLRFSAPDFPASGFSASVGAASASESARVAAQRSRVAVARILRPTGPINVVMECSSVPELLRQDGLSGRLPTLLPILYQQKETNERGKYDRNVIF